MEPSENMQFGYFSLGSNLGDREGNLKLAVKQMEKLAGTRAIISGMFRSESWGYHSQFDFYNCCMAFPVSGSPRFYFELLQRVESTFGRERKSNGYADRKIDIDLLLFGDRIVNEPDLIIPHPRMQDRRFVLQPMVEIAPYAVHPVLGLTMQELLESCTDRSEVTPL